MIPLNDDCLLEILSLLTLDDLINVNKTEDDRLKLASEITFVRKWKNVPTIVNVKELTNCKRSLKAFGNLITKVVIELKTEEAVTLLEIIEKRTIKNLRELYFITWLVMIMNRVNGKMAKSTKMVYEN